MLQDYARECAERKIPLIIAGDKKSPQDFELPGATFLNTKQQEESGFHLSRLLPFNHYSRKNMAYLYAMRGACTVLVEVDDDNQALPGFWQSREEKVKGLLNNQSGWVNAYRHFSKTDIWPRGFALKQLEKKYIPSSHPGIFDSPVQQSLADLDPDVDAIYRLGGKLPLSFEKNHPLILGGTAVCPFNSQNTTWFKKAFPLLYIPSTCSFRMCDIWRGLIAQRIMKENNWHLSFHNANVVQHRNEHDLLKDLQQEVDGYLYSEELAEKLQQLTLLPGEENLAGNLRACYQLLLSMQLVDHTELPMLEARLRDVQENRNAL